MKWIYYNHALVPDCAPHEIVDFSCITREEKWKQKGVLLARWTSNYDCEKANWWYVVKDDEYDISSLKSKRRYEINKGKNNFDVRVINPFRIFRRHL